MEPTKRSWIIDVLVGGVIGGLTGAIIAVNLVITAGIDRGYQATIPEIFRENAFVGVATVAILAAGPLLGVVGARWLRRRRPTG